MTRTRVVTRFAPSPTGYLHLGHALAARVAASVAGEAGRFLVRVEDLEPDRVREGYVVAILEDLAWLGLAWEPDVWRQSTRGAAYAEALQQLTERGDVYPCFCSRKEVAEELARAGGAPQGELGPSYPGTCRNLPEEERERRRRRGDPYAMRFDLGNALDISGPVAWWERGVAHSIVASDDAVRELGDPILARRDGSASYHLAVVVDDAAQGVTVVTRGWDLRFATPIQRLLQERLGLPAPEYHHHDLVVDEHGKRLAKRDDARAIRQYREAGWSVSDVWTTLERNRQPPPPLPWFP